MSAIEVQILSLGSFQSNCSVVSMAELGKFFVVDPGAESEQILKHVNEPLDFIWLTHAHLDHIGALEDVHQKTNFPEIFLHKKDLPLYSNIALQCQMFGATPFTVPEKISETSPEHKLFSDDLSFKILHVPGHSPGSCVLFLEGDIVLRANRGLGIGKKLNVKQIAIAGDTLFRGSIGRTDLWQGNHDLLLSGIREKLFTLPDETVVIPGHGPITTIGREKQSNPFLQA